MPTILRIKKYRLFFSNEGNEFPHIHIESGKNYAKFWLKDVALAKSSVGYNAKEINEIRAIILENINIIKDKWNEYFSS